MEETTEPERFDGFGHVANQEPRAPVVVVQRKRRGRPPKKRAAPPPLPPRSDDPAGDASAKLERRLADVQQHIADGVVDLAPEDDGEAQRRHLAWLAEKITWTMPGTVTGDPVRIGNAEKTWELWPGQTYRTPRGIMLTACPQADENRHIETFMLKDRGNLSGADKRGPYLGHVE